MTVCRCTICNAVNNLNIETDIGEYTSNRFYEEEDGGFICFACRSSVLDTLSEFEEEEEEEIE